MRAQRVASQLLVELCGAELVPGTIDIAGGPERRRRSVAGGPDRGVARDGDRAGRPGRLPGAARLRGRGRRRGPRGHGAARPPLDVTREVHLIEEVGRVHGFDEHLPTTLPAVAGRVGGLSRNQPLRRRAEDALARARLRPGRRLELHRPRRDGRLRIWADDPRGRCVANPLSEDGRRCGRPCSARCSTSPPATSPAALTRSPSSSPAASTCAARRRAETRLTGDRPVDPLAGASGQRPRRSPSRTGSPRSPSGRWSKAWRGGGEPADSSRSRACSRRWPPARRRAELRARRASRSCTRAAGPRSRSAARPPAGSARFTRWSAGSGTSRRRSALKSTPGALIGAASVGVEIYEDVTTFPAAYQDLAVVVPAEVRATAVRDAILAGGGELLRTAGSSTSTRASSSARAARASRCGSSSAPPTGPSPTRRSRRCGRRSRRSWSAIGGTLRE